LQLGPGAGKNVRIMRALHLIFFLSFLFVSPAPAATPWPFWEEKQPVCQVISPSLDPTASRLALATLDRHLQDFYLIRLPAATSPDEKSSPGIFLVLGSPQNNPPLARLVQDGLALTQEELGEEGFELRTWEHGQNRYVIVHARTPRGLKHGCQELIYYHLSADPKGGRVTAPLAVVRKPAFAYRGIYMLPCWAAHDSLESWERVLRFNSELTLNRNWFWLDGFPVAGHTGEYAGTDLADPAKVQQLLDLAVAEAMKIYVGGGWFNWHHQKAVGKDLPKGLEYYLAYLKHFSNFHGFYIEPTGEGSEIKTWRAEGDTLRRLIRTVHQLRPEFEFALAIGKFNNPEYLKWMSELDPNRVFWWWCWGDPIRDRALDLYPSVLRWHLSQKMSDYHGAIEPPSRPEQALTGLATSYDPGQGFGNPWNGWAALGVNQPRNFHPHTLPYFAQQYFFRERCWDLDLTESGFIQRLQRRLFDQGAPAEAALLYWHLSQMAQQSAQKQLPTPAQLQPVKQLVSTLRALPATPRMEDTIQRMDETLTQLGKRMASPGPQKKDAEIGRRGDGEQGPAKAVLIRLPPFVCSREGAELRRCRPAEFCSGFFFLPFCAWRLGDGGLVGFGGGEGIRSGAFAPEHGLLQDVFNLAVDTAQVILRPDLQVGPERRINSQEKRFAWGHPGNQL
jgi:hypothetical protein